MPTDPKSRLGKGDSKKAIYGENVYYADIKTFKNPNLIAGQSRLKYLGLKGSYFFFLGEKDNDLYLVRSDEVPVLQLKRVQAEKGETQKPTATQPTAPSVTGKPNTSPEREKDSAK